MPEDSECLREHRKFVIHKTFKKSITQFVKNLPNMLSKKTDAKAGHSGAHGGKLTQVHVWGKEHMKYVLKQYYGSL